MGVAWWQAASTPAFGGLPSGMQHPQMLHARRCGMHAGFYPRCPADGTAVWMLQCTHHSYVVHCHRWCLAPSACVCLQVVFTISAGGNEAVPERERPPWCRSCTHTAACSQVCDMSLHHAVVHISCIHYGLAWRVAHSVLPSRRGLSGARVG